MHTDSEILRQWSARRQRLAGNLHGEDFNESSWILSLSDLMSLLLIFFLVWTTIKISETEKSQFPHQDVVARQENLEKIRGLFMEFEPVESKENIMVVLDGEILFDSGSSKINQDGLQLLYRIARLLKKNPRFNLRVIGHTDNVPLKPDSPWSSNLELSLARGSSVAAALVSYGIPASRIFVQGEGEFYPRRDNTDVGQRAFNRRVELVIEPI